MPLDEPTPEQIRDEQVFLEMGLNASEYKEVVRRLGRLPNLTEAGIFGVMWSEHCSYKNSKPLLGRYPTEGPRIMQGPGEGAGVVDLGEGWAAVGQDQLRVAERLRQRNQAAQDFFAGAADQWDKLRAEMYGPTFGTDALLSLLPSDWTVADLGCGTGALALELSRHVGRVIGIDNTPAMLDAAPEARIFPLLDLDGEPSRHVDPVRAALEARGHGAAIERVDYEFQKGGHAMLRVWR